jgi:uncharacterized protein YgiM (DUF1202 family)
LRLALLVGLASLVLSVGSLGSLPVVRAAEDLPVGSSAVVTGTAGRELRIRSGPGIGYRIVTIVAEGSTVQILAGPVSDGTDDWYQVGTGGTVTGWSLERYLTPAQPTASHDGARRELVARDASLTEGPFR